MSDIYLNGYELNAPLKNDNSGFSKWGFCTKAGKEYFIKEFLSPVYPSGEGMSESQIAAKIRNCEKFEREKAALYNKINISSRGNVIRIKDFFRFENHYYIVTDKIPSLALSPSEIAGLPMKDRLAICRVIAHEFYRLHSEGIVHCDVKPDNILLQRTKSGRITAKIIDFDNSFLVTNPPPLTEEFNGDLVYMSPEGFMRIREEDVELTTKLDIYSLALLFCYYLSGELPIYNDPDCDYAFEATLDGIAPQFPYAVPEKFCDLFERMLSENPDDRPDAYEVYLRFGGSDDRVPQRIDENSYRKPVVKSETNPAQMGKKVDKYFYTPGEL